ncbi:hypothetical protein BASA50_001750 [Batrachochytrium salamandrivorans]|uniref:PLOD1-3-like GT domain-containing protein n=3 Tax=Batrachochytrium salamandrivorans TaxID=1357716 RepID=A0ABQ8FR72_9FUNG|nr:hypothetical protein BASA62_007523 [Batrachochytrium salamandrivorans]KAH6582731.1 hypothetical protein BASA60_001793 [Batrachochytrium salamandrivorans]KAH6601224.1 hypothetical protein BASA50_001750 [Batrachochytrium salamandrivorans]KAH9251000.1 hypothetical protein BASA81_011175 [Batrachochytrium salamandrivorans]
MLITISVTFTLSWFYLQENKPIQPYAANDHIQTYAANDSIQPHAANDHIQSYAANDQIQHEVEPIQEKIYDDKTWDFGHGGQLQSRVKTHHKTERLLAANTMCRDGWDQYLSVTKCKDDITLASVTGPDGFLANPLAANATAVAELNSAIGIIRPSTIVADEHSNEYCRAKHSSCPIQWVTYCSHCSLGTNRLATSISKANIPLAVLGFGIPWKSRWGHRIRTFHDYLLSQPEDRLILWSDADDVIITPETTIDKIMQQYKALVDLANGPRVVFAAESPCYPRGDLWRNYTKPSDIPGGRGDSPFRYLNAGFMIGPAGLIRRMIEVVYQHDCFDDQLVYTLAYLDPLVWWRDAHTNEYQVSSSRQNRTEIPYYAKQLIQLDHWNLLSMAMYGVKNEKYVVDDANTRLTMLETNSNPLILHQSGQKTTNRILEILAMVFGYDYDAPALDKLEEEGHPFRLMSRP